MAFKEAAGNNGGSNSPSSGAGRGYVYMETFSKLSVTIVMDVPPFSLCLHGNVLLHAHVLTPHAHVCTRGGEKTIWQ